MKKWKILSFAVLTIMLLQTGCCHRSNKFLERKKAHPEVKRSPKDASSLRKRSPDSFMRKVPIINGGF